MRRFRLCEEMGTGRDKITVACGGDGFSFACHLPAICLEEVPLGNNRKIPWKTASFPFSCHLPDEIFSSLKSGSPCISCPELSQTSAFQARFWPRSGFLSIPVAIPPTSLSMSAKRFSCFSMTSLPLSQPFKSAKRHSIHSCSFPSALLPRPSRTP